MSAENPQPYEIHHEVPAPESLPTPVLPIGQPYRGAKLFVGQIPREYTEEMLQPYFVNFGEITEIKIIRDRISREHKGCCFITFANKDDAEKAIIEYANFTLPRAKNPLIVKWAQGEQDRLEHKLFVGMIPKTCTREEVEQLFAPFGAIRECVLLPGALNANKCSAFVKYEDRNAAEHAIATLHMKHCMPNSQTPLVVRFADTEKSRKEKMLKLQQQQQQHMYRNQQGLAAWNQYSPQPFPGAGPQASMYQTWGGYNTFASNPGSAPLGQTPGSDYGLSNYGTQSYSAYNTGPALPPGVLGGNAEGPEGANLFVYHVPNEWSERDLYNNFQGFGQVLSCKVFMDKSTMSSRGFGFVSFATVDAAHAAINNMNGCQVSGGKRLKVQPKIKKDSFTPY